MGDWGFAVERMFVSFVSRESSPFFKVIHSVVVVCDIVSVFELLIAVQGAANFVVKGHLKVIP